MNFTDMLKKIFSALAGSLRTFRLTPRPRLVMTLLVKNEEELLERNLLFHKAAGVDAFIVTDNNSTDRTPEILEKYRKKGWIVEIIRETATDYAQKQWVDRMVVLARDRYGADWVINADADEFWHSPSGSLKDVLSHTRANVLDCEVRNVLPEEDTDFTQWDKTVREVPDREAFDLSLYSIFGRVTKKVIHRTAGYLQISMGNHKVAMLPRRSAPADVVVYHYNIRGRRQFMEKMINGGRQLEQRRKQHGGRHWRYFYALWKEGRLEAEYDRVTGVRCRDRLLREGYVRQDCPLPRILRNLEIQ